MVKVVWSFIILSFLLFLAAVLKWGIAPRAIKLIDPSGFTEPLNMGAAIYNRLRQELEHNPVVVMGGHLQEPIYQDIVQGFLQRSAQDGRPFQHIWAEENMLPQAVKEFSDSKEHLEEIVQAIRNLKPGDRLFLYTDFAYTTHLLANNLIHHLEHQLERKVMSISLTRLARRTEELEHLPYPCRGLIDDKDFTAKLGCTIAARSRSVFRKKVNWLKYVLVLDQQGSADYLGLVRAPGP